jgi:hypothetical protein
MLFAGVLMVSNKNVYIRTFLMDAKTAFAVGTYMRK